VPPEERRAVEGRGGARQRQSRAAGRAGEGRPPDETPFLAAATPAEAGAGDTGGEGGGSSERWLLTYADMITLLLAPLRRALLDLGG